MQVSVHQLRSCKPAKKAYNLVHQKRKIKALRGFVHQLRSCKPAKKAYDLVQRKRKIKALRGSVHQLRSCKPVKKAYDLVQRKRKIKALRGSVHQLRAGSRETGLRPSTEVPGMRRKPTQPPGALPGKRFAPLNGRIRLSRV